MSERVLIADALRAARANGWRPRYPQARCLGQWTWTSVTQPQGLPPTGARHVTLDGDWVHVKQFSDAQGWISGASVKATSARQAVDVLVAMGILPPYLSSAFGLAEDKYREVIEAAGSDRSAFATAMEYLR